MGASPFFLWRKFSFRIMLLLILVSIILSTLTAAVVGWMSRTQLEETIGAGLGDVSFQMADKLDRSMFERSREITILSRSRHLRLKETSYAEKREILEEVKATMPDHAWIAITDAKGIVQVATSGLLEGKNVSHRPWFEPGKVGPYVGDVHGALLLSKHMTAPPDGNLRFVDTAAPIFSLDGNQLLGVLCSHLTWEWARDVETSLFRDVKQRKGIEVFVFGSGGEPLLVPEGTTVASWPNLKDLVATAPNKVGHTLINWPDGEYLTGYAPTDGYKDYRGLGWVVLARQSTKVAFIPSRALWTRTLGYGILFGLLAALAGGILSNRVSKPLLRIAGAAESIRGGNLEVGIPLIESPEEIASLSFSLQQLVSDLVEKNKALSLAKESLEEKVKARTAQLQKSNEQLEKLSRTDALTGIANRRKFDKHLADSFRRFRRYKYPLSLLIIDIDHFKYVNDYYGHQKGDEYLQKVASVLNDIVDRVDDLPARYGGEEFALILEDTTAEGAVNIAEEIRQRIFKLHLENQQSEQEKYVTVSIGIASALLGHDENSETLIKRADQALYEAKKTGRNRVVLKN